ncbi:hypothetical protein [Streptomyces sp. NPDC090445]|uniref:hypothetical protein n=1 Tax=Streptomyces sp. NPDC090445 TaxID=3365963 RepID=UPI00382E8FBC
MDLFTPLDLPHGGRLPNRLAKAAMEEGLAGPGQLPGERIEHLYRRWAQGGAGLLITGNVMVDRRALTAPGTVVLDAHAPSAPSAAGPGPPPRAAAGSGCRSTTPAGRSAPRCPAPPGRPPRSG